MNLTKGRRQKIIERFRDENASIEEIADWYEQPPRRVEEIIREGLKSAHDRLVEMAFDRAVGNQ